VPEPFTPYQKRLFVFLSVATFFEGYDFMALTQILPELRKSFGLNEAEGGFLVAFINIGTVLAYFLVRRADRWGRRRVLTLTIAGYTTFTFLCGIAPNIWAFAVFQMLARIFLLAEWAISMVFAAEEFPAARRGMVIGVVSACASLGSVLCAGIAAPMMNSPFGWRTVYLVGILPLVIIAFARRGLKETRRFEETGPAEDRGLLHIWRTPHKKRVIQVGAIWFLTYICTQNAVTWWKEFAVSERQMTPGQVGLRIAIAAVAAMPLVFLVGRLLDWVGRRWGAVIIFVLGALGSFLAYTLVSHNALTVALVFGIFGASAVLIVLNAFTTELFPTELRGDAFAWTNNLLGRVSYVTSPAVVGLVAHQLGWGAANRWTAIFPVIALILILRLLPETRGRELEETAAA
jgi:putative MFS transporter